MTQRARTALAWLFSVWTVLQAATMVRAAVVGGPTSDAIRFFATGVVTLILGLVSWSMWGWVRRHARRLHGPPTPPELDLPPRRHSGLTGEQPPPRRW